MIVLLLITTLFFGGCFVTNEGPVVPIHQAAQSSGVNSGEWKAGVYRGLTVGTSTRDDAIRLLGQPLDSGESANDLPVGEIPPVVDEYNFSDGYEGKLAVSWNKESGVIINIAIYPKHLPLEDALDRYGRDFVVSRYDFLDCPGDAGSSRMIASPEGPLEYLEYRSQGIELDVDKSKSLVRSVEYVKGASHDEDGDCST